MRRKRWRLWFAVGLVALSTMLFGIHFLVFRDWHHLAIYTLGDIAFVPLEVLFVALILHELLDWHERRELQNKLKMLIGAFYSEVGIDLLERLSVFDTRPDELRRDFDVEVGWTDARLRQAAAVVEQRSFDLQPTREGVVELREFMMSKRQFLLRLLENPNLLENERFTDMMWAVFHLGDELAHRKDIARSPDTDILHLGGDMERAYGHLIGEWFEHLRHLKARYPFLFSLGVRTNPLDFEAGVEVLE